MMVSGWCMVGSYRDPEIAFRFRGRVKCGETVKVRL